MTHLIHPDKCPNHQAFRRDAIAVLDLAVTNFEHSRPAVLALNVRYGPGISAAAMTVWIDTLVARAPHVSADTDADDQVARWAARVIAARRARDRSAFEELCSIPKGLAAVEAHVMGLLALLAALLSDTTKGEGGTS